MNFFETLITALKSLKTNKIRSALTMLGIVIGVFAVLSLVSLVQGAKNYISDQFNTIGSNLILIAPGRFSFNTDPSITFANNKLTEDDVDDLNKKAAEFIVAASPSVRLSKTVEYKSTSFLANIIGANYRISEITNHEIEKGRLFTKAEEVSNSRVAFIGAQVRKTLFPNTDAIGKTIKIAGYSFTVIATMTPKGTNSDDIIIVPYTALKNSLGVKNLSGIMVKVKPNVELETAQLNIEQILLNNHKKDEFGVATQADILRTFQSVLGALSLGLGAIAGISLFVGGIGIMNIMLVSVSERTSEIGLRKALGATPGNIAMQFIAESAFLSIIGGIIGIFFGYLLTYSIRNVIRAEIPLWSLLLSFGFSLVVGIIFGTYPAILAGRKDPIEALRYEV